MRPTALPSAEPRILWCGHGRSSFARGRTGRFLVRLRSPAPCPHGLPRARRRARGRRRHGDGARGPAHDRFRAGPERARRAAPARARPRPGDHPDRRARRHLRLVGDRAAVSLDLDPRGRRTPPPPPPRLALPARPRARRATARRDAAAAARPVCRPGRGLVVISATEAPAHGPGFLARKDLGALFALVRDDGRRLIGPTVRDGAVMLDELDGPDALPEGIRESQTPRRWPSSASAPASWPRSRSRIASCWAGPSRIRTMPRAADPRS